MVKKKRVVRRKTQAKSIISDDITIPNHSGMLDAGKVHRVATDDLDPVNKKYVDDENDAQTLQTITNAGNTTTNSVMIGSSSAPNNNLQVDNLINFDNTNLNVLLGTDAGLNLAQPSGNAGKNNVFIGKNSGAGLTTFPEQTDNTGFFNVGLGINTLRDLTSGTRNFALGFGVLGAAETASRNVGIGESALQNVISGGDNIGIGRWANRKNKTGQWNVGIGSMALDGVTNQSQSGNVGIGQQAGGINTGSNNIFLGFMAGVRHTSGSNTLIIDNQDRGSEATELTDSLIVGTFKATKANQILRINGRIDGSEGAKIGDGGTTNYTDIDNNGKVVFVGTAGLAFGEIYARDNTATTSTSTTKAQILIFDTDGEFNNMTAVNAQGHLLVTKAGKYKIDTSISIKNSSGSAHVINVEMYKNDGATVFNNIHAGRNLGTGSDVGNLTMSGIVDLAVNDTIEIWITSDSASARTVTVEDIDFSAIQIGGT